MNNDTLLLQLRRRLDAIGLQHVPLQEVLWLAASALKRDYRLADSTYHAAIADEWQRCISAFLRDAWPLKNCLAVEGLDDPVAGHSLDTEMWLAFLDRTVGLPDSSGPLRSAAHAVSTLRGAWLKAETVVFQAAERGMIVLQARQAASAALEAIPAGYFTLPRSFDAISASIAIELPDMRSVFDERLDTDVPPWHGPILNQREVDRVLLSILKGNERHPRRIGPSLQARTKEQPELGAM